MSEIDRVGGPLGNAVSQYHTLRVRLQRFAKAWSAALPAGADPGPLQIAQTALDRDDQCRRQAGATRNTAAATDRIVDQLVDGEIDLDQAADAMLDVARLRDRAEIADRILERVGVRVLQRAVKELEALGDRLITECLRPAFAAAVEELTRLSPTLEGIRTDEDAIKASPSTAKAWARAVQLVGHCSLLRSAPSDFTTRLDSQSFGAFKWWANPEAVPKRQGRGPVHPVRAILDAIAGGAGPGLHTAAEVLELSQEFDRSQRAAMAGSERSARGAR